MQLMRKILTDDYIREIGDFECEEEGMEYFLKNEALDYDKNGEGNTYLIINKDDNKIVGYYTLKCNAIEIKKSKVHKILPSIEIARLATDINYKGQGIGSIMLSLIVKSVLAVKKHVGVKFIYLFSVPSAEKFYREKNRINMLFEEMPSDVRFLKDENSQDECTPLIITVENLPNIST